jgi:hypothetical protein
MGRQMLFYGLLNLFLGIILFVVFTLYLPPLIGSVGIDCKDEGLFTCGGLMPLVTNVTIMVSVIGLAQILYWIFFEKDKEDVTVKATAAAGGMAPGKFRVCPECQMSNDPVAKFCTECGYDFSKKKPVPKK